MSKINGITVGTPMPRTNFNQTDPNKADYLVGREKIADALIVNIDYDPSTEKYKSSATYAEIYEHVKKGGTVYAVLDNDNVYNLAYVDDNEAVFQYISDDKFIYSIYIGEWGVGVEDYDMRGEDGRRTIKVTIHDGKANYDAIQIERFAEDGCLVYLYPDGFGAPAYALSAYDGQYAWFTNVDTESLMPTTWRVDDEGNVEEFESQAVELEHFNETIADINSTLDSIKESSNDNAVLDLGTFWVGDYYGDPDWTQHDVTEIIPYKPTMDELYLTTPPFKVISLNWESSGASTHETFYYDSQDYGNDNKTITMRFVRSTAFGNPRVLTLTYYYEGDYETVRQILASVTADNRIGDIETALDSIISIQESLIGGGNV